MIKQESYLNENTQFYGINNLHADILSLIVYLFFTRMLSIYLDYSNSPRSKD